jgi:hypothetical protein
MSPWDYMHPPEGLYEEVKRASLKEMIEAEDI